MFKKWKEKRLAASFNNASGVIAALSALKLEQEPALTFSVAPRGASVVITTNIPAYALCRDNVEVIATPRRLIAKGDIQSIPATHPSITVDCVSVNAAKPDAVPHIINFVAAYAAKRELNKSIK